MEETASYSFCKNSQALPAMGVRSLGWDDTEEKIFWRKKHLYVFFPLKEKADVIYQITTLWDQETDLISEEDSN